MFSRLVVLIAVLRAANAVSPFSTRSPDSAPIIMPTKSKTSGPTSQTSSSGMPKTSKPLRASTILCAASTGLSAKIASLLAAPMPSPTSPVCFCAHCPLWPRKERLELRTCLIHLSPTQPRNRHKRWRRAELLHPTPFCGKPVALCELKNEERSDLLRRIRPCQESAVEDQGLAGHKGRAVRAHPDNGFRNFHRGSKSAHGMQAENLLLDLRLAKE